MKRGLNDIEFILKFLVFGAAFLGSALTLAVVFIIHYFTHQ